MNEETIQLAATLSEARREEMLVAFSADEDQPFEEWLEQQPDKSAIEAWFSLTMAAFATPQSNSNG